MFSGRAFDIAFRGLVNATRGLSWPLAAGVRQHFRLRQQGINRPAFHLDPSSVHEFVVGCAQTGAMRDWLALGCLHEGLRAAAAKLPGIPDYPSVNDYQCATAAKMGADGILWSIESTLVSGPGRRRLRGVVRLNEAYTSREAEFRKLLADYCAARRQRKPADRAPLVARLKDVYQAACPQRRWWLNISEQTAEHAVCATLEELDQLLIVHLSKDGFLTLEHLAMHGVYVLRDSAMSLAEGFDVFRRKAA